MTACYGLTVVAEASASESVVVSGAAGATSSMVIQIAKKLIRCKQVIGIASTDDKCRWAESPGADKCLNYKKSSFREDLTKQTDGFFDVFLTPSVARF